MRKFEAMKPLNVVMLITAGVLWLVMAVSSASCVRSQWHQTGGAAWGTTFTVKYYGDRSLDDSVVAVMRQVELALSMFEPSSNISRINRAETDTLAPMTAEVFAAAQRVSALSGGMFDPTVAPLVNLWGFGVEHAVDDAAPDSADVSAALLRVGIVECWVDSAAVLHRKNAGMTFDFSAIAKGYGVDCVADMLRRNGCTNFMVEIGGEISALGCNSRGEPWQIQIDSPSSGVAGHEQLETIGLTDRSVATSGNYRNWRKLGDGSRVGHTISPKTGYPVQRDVVAATVIAPRCVTADALATAAMAMGADSARVMFGSLPEVSALLVLTDGSEVRIGEFWKNQSAFSARK